MANDEVTRVKEQDLVLNVSKSVDPNLWNENTYLPFIDLLCKGRNYQQDAILTTLRYLLGGKYQNLDELAKENFYVNDTIKARYGNDYLAMRENLSLPNKLSANIDLATGTGKSYVLYAIAIIMMATRAVDRVLIIVPSVTIESELTTKFKYLSTNRSLVQQLTNLGITIPSIINGSESIVPNTICIENRDAIYTNARTSITDSLRGNGERTLVMSDEVHHVYNETQNEWKKFITDDYHNSINFKYVIGVSGTCYKGNEYFADVIYRYSLRQAIEDKRVKTIDYIIKADIPTKSDHKWQVILDSHNQIKEDLHNHGLMLPLSIVVTQTTATCDRVAREFKQFLMKSQDLSEEDVNHKVLVVHSKPSAAFDRLRLKSVDDITSQAEWIFSVSMLTEGWDVKRVFQIIPHEERAFNSKLLIAQVMGRGLRIPNNWDVNNFGQPKVRIFNHESWASSVQRLVNEVLEIEKKITVRIINDSIYNFTLTNVRYETTKNTSNNTKEGEYALFEKGYIDLPTDTEEQHVAIESLNILNDTLSYMGTYYNQRTYTSDEIALAMYSRFSEIPMSDGSDGNDTNLEKKYQEEWPVDKLKTLINNSLVRSSNNVITEHLKQKLLSSLGTIMRTGAKFVVFNTRPSDYYNIDTSHMRSSSVSASSLRRSSVLFSTSSTIQYIDNTQKDFYDNVIDSMNGYKHKFIDNLYNFKTPQSAVIADSDPEKEFIYQLIEPLNNQYIEKWIKSTGTGFYSIDYSWRKGEHTRTGGFNPDFFIKLKDIILVAEIKSNDQISEPDIENIGKYKAGISHFDVINELINSSEKFEDSRVTYKFTMITPRSFDILFNIIRSCDTTALQNFRSELDVKLNEY